MVCRLLSATPLPSPKQPYILQGPAGDPTAERLGEAPHLVPLPNSCAISHSSCYPCMYPLASASHID